MVMGKRNPNNLYYLNRDRGYRFTDNRDPVLEEITNLITQSGLSSKEISQRTAKQSGGAMKVAAKTIDQWLSGHTKKPQNFTVTWVAYVIGWQRRWVRR